MQLIYNTLKNNLNRTFKEFLDIMELLFDLYGLL